MKRMRFEFEAMTETGAEVVDVVYAATEKEAAAAVKARGLYLTSFTHVDGKKVVKKLQKPKARPSWLTTFCKSLRERWASGKWRSWFCRSQELAQPVLNVS